MWRVFAAFKGNQSRWSHEGYAERQRGYAGMHFASSSKFRTKPMEGKCPHSADSSGGHLSEQWNVVRTVSLGKLWQRRWEAEPLIISWQDNNVPCCLLFLLLFSSGRSWWREDSARRGNSVLYDCEKLCAVGPVSISDERYLFFHVIIP